MSTHVVVVGVGTVDVVVPIVVVVVVAVVVGIVVVVGVVVVVGSVVVVVDSVVVVVGSVVVVDVVVVVVDVVVGASVVVVVVVVVGFGVVVVVVVVVGLVVVVVVVVVVTVQALTANLFLMESRKEKLSTTKAYSSWGELAILCSSLTLTLLPTPMAKIVMFSRLALDASVRVLMMWSLPPSVMMMATWGTLGRAPNLV